MFQGRLGTVTSLDKLVSSSGHCNKLSKENHTGHSERKRGRQKRPEGNIKEWTGVDFASLLGQLKTGQDEKGLLRKLWDRIE